MRHSSPVPALQPVADPAAAHRACTARVLEREGIPVVLALVDRRRGAEATGPPPAPPEAGLVEVFDAYAAALAPGAADDDAAALYSVVELLGWAHVHPGPAPAAGPAGPA